MSKKKTWLLSVDWDTFVPENPAWDFGHAETQMFATLAWLTRGHALEVMKTTGEEHTFWQRVQKRTRYHKTFPIFLVSDSHAMLGSMLNTFEIDEVVLVDAHHDMWPVACEGSYTCSDWLRIWLEEYKQNRARWIQPEWSADMFEVPSDLKKRVKHTLLPNMEKLLPATPPVAIHLCRSGSWTPPWLDAAFIEFTLSAGLRPTTLQQKGWFDPMVERWSVTEYTSARQIHEATVKMQEKDLLRRRR